MVWSREHGAIDNANLGTGSEGCWIWKEETLEETLVVRSIMTYTP